MRSNLADRLFRKSREDGLLRPGVRVAAAVSGGADSVALLRLFMELRAEWGVVVSAVHFNHRLRGKASELDEKFVTELAEKLGATLHVGRADVAWKAKREKANLEDAARRARYEFFAKLAGQGAVDWVATAHTQDDQAETVLAHILRGTGVAGLSGIHPVSGCVVRPLLGFRREELRKYLRAKRQTWREDRTNRDLTRTRARMRNKLLPLLEKEFNPAAVEHLAALADRAREQWSLVQHLAGQAFAKSVTMNAGEARVVLAELLSPLGTAPSAAALVLQSSLIQEVVERTRQKRGQILSGHIERIVQLAKDGEPGKRLQMPGGIDVLRERDALVFQPRKTQKQ